MYRAFIAIRLSTTHQEVINHALDTLKPTLNTQGIFWEPPKNWHVTLRFLGNISEWQGEAILRQLSRQVMHHPAFSLDAKEWCFLPSINDRRFLALTLKPDSKIQTLYSNIGRCLASLGVMTDEQDFMPHITVARLSKPNIDLNALKFVPPISVPIDNVTLYRSEWISKTPDYAVISKLLLPA